MVVVLPDPCNPTTKIFTGGTLLKFKSFYHKKTQAYKIGKWKSLEIDDIDDFNLAKFYAKELKLLKKLN